MKLNRLVSDSYRAFFEYSNGAQVVLLHPKSRYRSILVARLLNTPELETLYYAMGPDDMNVPAFISGIIHDLSGQHPAFGRNLNLVAHPNNNGNWSSWLQALAADLAEWTDQPFLLILDEYDYSDGADDVQQFIQALVPLIPPHGKLVINSRTLPRQPWVAMLARNHAIILHDAHLITEDFYDNQGSSDNPVLEVTALGPGYVSLNDQLITSWEGHLPRLLFFFALDRPTVTRTEICQALWPDLDVDQAVNVFHVTKRRLHKALGEDILVHEDGYYRVNPALSLRYDVMDFVSALVKSRAASGETKINELQKAIDIYKGPFLQGHDDTWILDRRLDFRTGYLEAVTAMAAIRYNQGQAEQALRLYLMALSVDASEQELHRQVMRLFAELGRRSEAAAHYQKLRQEMPDLSPETTAVFQEIMT